jgi:hypothetical protein
MRRHAIRLFTVSLLTAMLVGLVGAAPAWAQDPTIASFTPTSGPVGTTVTITGTNFNNPPVNLVEFDSHDASFTVVNATTIRATVPNDATDGLIEVRNVDGTATSSMSFNVTQGPGPTITSFSPTSGPVGTVVTIRGTHFNSPVVVEVEFASHDASFNVVNDTTITATVPSNATDGRIQVRNANGTATSSMSFNVTQAPRPTITSFAPTSGRIGTSVVIRGTNFSGTGFTTSAVKFNGVTAAFIVNSATQVTATVPSGATTGRISLTTPGGTVTSAASFTVVTFHSRSVTLNLHRHLIARGIVTAADAFAACIDGVSVKVQERRRFGGWRTVRTTATAIGGAYHVRLPDEPGLYRAIVPRSGTTTDVCTKDKSPRRRHRH